MEKLIDKLSKLSDSERESLINKLSDSEKESLINDAKEKLLKVIDVINQSPESEKKDLEEYFMMLVKKESKKLKTKFSKHP